MNANPYGIHCDAKQIATLSHAPSATWHMPTKVNTLSRIRVTQRVFNWPQLKELAKPNDRGYNWATLVLGGNKYRNMALQVGGV
jgi:hypothetical protein